MSAAQPHGSSVLATPPGIAPSRRWAAAGAFLFALAAGVAGFALWRDAEDGADLVPYVFSEKSALDAADAAADYALVAFRATLDSQAAVSPPPPSGDTVDAELLFDAYEITPLGAPTRRRIDAGACQGLELAVQRYDITARTRDDSTGAEQAVRVSVDHALVPLFHFAIFYEDDLELHSGPALTITGRIHTNGDLYLDAFTGLNLDSYCTAAGRIVHGKPAASGEDDYGGPILIKDQMGVYRAMRGDDGAWLDHRHPGWLNAAPARWGGRVQDAAHGVTRLTLAGGERPRDMIRPGNPHSYEHRAGLKIIDGVAFHRRDGAWIDVTAALRAAGALRSASFYDARNRRRVRAREIDIGRLNASPYWPDSGILYVYDRPDGPELRAVRLVNGARLVGPLTVVSDNPVYTLGDYNILDKKPAAIFADAYTVLSGGWNDAHSAKSLGYRNAVGTTCQVALVTGIVPTQNGRMSGGSHNLPRFLENWTGDVFRWSGAMAQLWESEQATGAWSDADGSYNPPTRDWVYDSDLLDPSLLPPGTPLLNVIIKREPDPLVAAGRRNQ